MSDEHDLDAVGLLCPLPVLKIRKKMKSLQTGEVVRVLADDPAALVDIPHFCAEAGHELIMQDDAAFPAVAYYIRKG